MGSGSVFQEIEEFLAEGPIFRDISRIGGKLQKIQKGVKGFVAGTGKGADGGEAEREPEAPDRAEVQEDVLGDIREGAERRRRRQQTRFTGRGGGGTANVRRPNLSARQILLGG